MITYKIGILVPAVDSHDIQHSQCDWVNSEGCPPKAVFQVDCSVGGIRCSGSSRSIRAKSAQAHDYNCEEKTDFIDYKTIAKSNVIDPREALQRADTPYQCNSEELLQSSVNISTIGCASRENSVAENQSIGLASTEDNIHDRVNVCH